VIDILDEMTREEIIQWLRQGTCFYFNKPKKSEILFMRWETRAMALNTKDAAHTEKLSALGIDERNRLAAKYNASESPVEREHLLRKMSVINKKIKAWLTENQRHTDERLDIDRMLKDYEAERDREQKARKSGS